MIKGVTITGYKSLVDFDAVFDQGSKSTDLILIYGENGSGKTNFLSALYAVSSQINSLSYIHQLQSAFELDGENSAVSGNSMKDIVQNMSVKNLLSNNITLGQSKGSITVNFSIDGTDGYYTLEFDLNGLTKEKLYYLIKENRGVLYEINNNEGLIKSTISTNLVFDESFLTKVEQDIKLYWGKHSLLSILKFHQNNTNAKAFNSIINAHLIHVIDYFDAFFIKNLSEEAGPFVKRPSIIEDFRVDPLSGTIKVSQEHRDLLKELGEVIYRFITPLINEILDVRYQIIEKDKQLEYKLIIVKDLLGSIVDIPIDHESSGTRNLIRLLPYLSEYARGKVVIIDEIENAVHDILISEIIESLVHFKSSKGQFIATTHNTSIMERVSDANLFIISILDNTKILRSIKSYTPVRNRNINNLRKKYLEGQFYGIPFTRRLNLEEVFDIFE